MLLSLPALTISYAVGIFLGSFLPINPTVLFAICTILFLVVIWRVRGKREVGLLLFLLLALLGAFRYQLLWQRPSILDDFSGQEIVATGVVVQEPARQGDKLSFNLRLDYIQIGEELVSVQEVVLIEVQGGYAKEILYGDRIKIRGRVLKPAPPANFQVFNYSAYLRQQGIKYLLLPESGGITITSQGEGSFLIALALKVKKAMLGVIAETLPPFQGRILHSLLFGERTALEADFLQQLEKSGVMHLLAVSGLHVGFVASLGYGLGMLLRWPPRFSVLLSGLAVGFYLLLIGFRASVLRAGIMLWLGIFGLLLNRRAHSITALSAACLILLLVRPGLLFTAGFQLSFAATWGILYLSPLLVRAFAFLPRSLSYPLAVSGAAQLTTWPILAYHFQGVAPWSLFNNLVAVPLAGVIMGLGLIGCGVGLIFLPLAKLLAAANSLLIALFAEFIAITASLPFAYLYVPPPAPIFLVVYGALLILLPRLLFVSEDEGRGKGGRVSYKAIAAVLALFLVLSWILPSWGTDYLEVTFLSVGAGDAAIVTFPGGKTCLIDAGPGGIEEGFDAGAAVILPYLRRRGIRRLELIILTHPHRDHWGGLQAVMTEIPVGAILFPKVFAPEEFGLPADSALPLFGVAAGDKLALGQGVEGEVLHPPAVPLTGTNDDCNNNSLVLLLKIGEVGFLFPGDLEEAGEKYMLQYNRVPSATVLKVAHHGARDSSSWEFLQEVRPTTAVISTGPNSFGHPHRETLERLTALGINTYRTDRDGAVRVRTDGKRIWIERSREGGK